MPAKKTKKTNITGNKQTVINQPSLDSMSILWTFDKIDRNGKFAFSPTREDFDSDAFLEKIISYSSMTYGTITKQTHDDGKSKHHFLEGAKLSHEAEERIRQMHLENDTDVIFSFAFDNLLRIIGIMDKNIFHVIWYDPKHEFCPSTKKHT